MRIRLITIVLLYVSFLQTCFGMENSFYILHGQKHVPSSLLNHFQSIDVLISQAYHVNAKGKVSGFIDHDTLQFANQHAMRVMALVTNSNFDKHAVHQFLADFEAQKNAIQSILIACKQQHLYGVQFDFESVSLKDRDALTHFYRNAAYVLHKHRLVVSFAVIPITAGPHNSAFLKRQYENIGGAYDLKILGKIGDFISVMAYDQHTHGTMPGPTASIDWVNSVINYTLQYVPPQKISLGIPVYSDYWFTGLNSSNPHGRISTRLVELSYKDLKPILNKNHVKLHWDPDHGVNYAIYQYAWLNEYIFAEDFKSFKAKYDLAKKYHLRGTSIFSLGNEDPRIWDILTAYHIAI